MLRLRFLGAIFAGLFGLAGGVFADPLDAPSPDDAKHIRLLEHQPSGPYPAVGSDSAPVTFEYFFNIGNARSFGQLNLLKTLAARHPKRLRIIYRITDNRERSGSLAQVFGQEAFEQGRFFEFLEAFYAKRRGPSATKDFPKVAEEAGVDYGLVKNALESMQHDAFLNENHFYWKRMHLSAVPALLINGHRIVRIANMQTLEALYDQAYQEASRARAKGITPKELNLYLRSKDHSQDNRIRRHSGPVDLQPGELHPKSTQVVNMKPLLEGARSQGPADAKATLVFICHLQSNNCRTMSRSLRVLQRAYKREVRLIVRPLFDSEMPRQDKAQLMHEAAACAEEQGAYWEYYRLAFERQRQINFDQGFAVDLASSPRLDLDLASFETCLESGRHAAQVQEEVAAVRNAGVTHVPALAVGGLLYTGRLHFDQLREVVQKELAPGLLEAGLGALYH